ncbi:MAG: recombinase family protein [Prevotella sp.]|nr:recombinase family protein [Prevotella sp.]MDY4218456.1 recombinase family protein [Prevotella sp.]
MESTEERTRVCIYARVSTSHQDYTRQLSELRNYARKNNYMVVKEFAEKISGGKKIVERAALTELLDYVRDNRPDKILIYECSRLSRRATDFLSIIDHLNELKISLYILQNGLETLLPNGDTNPIAGLVCGIIAQFNQMEKNLIRSRMESGYQYYRENGGKVGRRVNYRKPDSQYKTDYFKEIDLLSKGVSLRDCQKITGTSVNTLRKIKTMFL